MDYFSRQIMLIGQEKQDSLKDKKVLVVGAGGLGCSIGYALGSLGLGKITFVDFDKVENHNIHRQIGFFLDDISKFKVDALSEKLKKRAKVDIDIIKGKFEDIKDNNFDLILDATDNLYTREKIDEFAKSYKIPWIYASVEEFRGMVCFFEKANFKDTFLVNSTETKGILTPMVMQIASFSSNLAIRYLLDLDIEKDTLFYFEFSKEFNIKKFSL